jgi:hypothetical protein
MDKRDFMRKILQKEEEAEEESLMSKEESYGDRDQSHVSLPETESTLPHNQYTQVRHSARLSHWGLALQQWSPNCFDYATRQNF